MYQEDKRKYHEALLQVALVLRHKLKALLGGGVELFGLRDVLDHLLNDDAVVDVAFISMW
jgi:spermidine synthase